MAKYSEQEFEKLMKENPSLKVQGKKAIPIQKQKQAQKHEAGRPAKYKNVKAESNGVKFQSKKERNRYDELILMLNAGEIEGLKLQETFNIQRGFTTIDGERIQPIAYSCDFSYYHTGTTRRVVEDCKGFKTAKWKNSWKMMKYNYPEFEYRIT